MTKNIFHENVIPSDFTNVNFCTFVEKGVYTPNHWHRAIEIIYMLEGRFFRYMEDETYELTVGKCMIVNSNVIHSDKTLEYSRYILLQIPIDFIEKFIPEIEQLRFEIPLRSSEIKKLAVIDNLKELLWQMKILNDKQEKGFLLKFNSLLFEVLFLLYNNFSEKAYTSKIEIGKKDFERLDKVLKYIKQNYKRPIALAEIAKVAIFSPDYFCRFFKKHMGMSFLEYQNELRLSYIYQDIINTKEPIYKILEKHGFTNYKIFRRMFYEHFETTPLNARKNMK